MKLIDADELLEWISGEFEDFEEEVQRLTYQINAGTFDPTPPVQPDIKPGDKIRHKGNPHYGIGVVHEIAKSGLRAHCSFPDYDKRVSHWEPRGYYRLDKLEVIKDE
ncbi:hypothetical protein [Paenibacillus sp. FSL R7-0333]|uniref:hypothetical protein n=1 Tax=Paenibacillus sp. FSL R7-0333 TaxID=1926587 RepID=UPI00096CA8DA|nr:hypothetical protein BK146_17895 [Paenibacillus sp. FSL R7-0333]